MLGKKKLLKIIEKAMEASFTNGKLNSKKAMDFVNQFKNLPPNQSIISLSEYQRLLKRKINDGVLYIESSAPLTSSQKKHIVSKFKYIHSISKVEISVNPSLLLGISIKLSDMVYEDTFASRMRQLKEAIVNG